MNTPNPLVPQGAFPDSRSKARFRIAFFSIIAVHLVLLGALLLQGCKPTATETAAIPEPTNNPYPAWIEPTNNPPVVHSNLTPETVATSTPPVNPIVVPPPDPVAPPVPAGGAGSVHTVVKGDAFYVLAKKYHVSSKAIAEANPGVDPTKLKIGHKLNIPASTAASASAKGVSENGPGNGTTHVVKSGDTLMKIAKAHGVTLKALRSANKLKTNQIKVGQKLKIPSKAAAVSGKEEAAAAAPVPPAGDTPVAPIP